MVLVVMRIGNRHVCPSPKLDEGGGLGTVGTANSSQKRQRFARFKQIRESLWRVTPNPIVTNAPFARRGGRGLAGTWLKSVLALPGGACGRGWSTFCVPPEQDDVNHPANAPGEQHAEAADLCAAEMDTV